MDFTKTVKTARSVDINDEFFNKHYIRTDENNNIVYGFSDAFEPPFTDDICINHQGGYQFRLFPGGEENPPLHDDWDRPLYNWNGTRIIQHTLHEG